jgi:hypothetical protein
MDQTIRYLKAAKKIMIELNLTEIRIGDVELKRETVPEPKVETVIVDKRDVLLQEEELRSSKIVNVDDRWAETDLYYLGHSKGNTY